MPLLINRRGRGILPSRRVPLAPAPADEDAPPAADPHPFFVDADNDEFETSLDDVLTVKQLLMQVGRLPVELTDIILDHAEYWACSVSSVDYTPLRSGCLMVAGGDSFKENAFLIRTLPLGLTDWTPTDEQAWRAEAPPQALRAEHPLQTYQRFTDNPQHTLEHPCRKIVFNIRSGDQGWGGDPAHRGKYEGSWTWFDAGLERFDAEAGSGSAEKLLEQSAIRPIWPPVRVDTDQQVWEPQYIHELHAAPDHKIQANKTATSTKQDHHVEWRWDDDLNPDELERLGRGRDTGDGYFVRSLKLGDIVTIWARVRFMSWVNEIEKVEVKVYWAV